MVKRFSNSEFYLKGNTKNLVISFFLVFASFVIGFILMNYFVGINNLLILNAKTYIYDQNLLDKQSALWNEYFKTIILCFLPLLAALLNMFYRFYKVFNSF